LKSWKFYANYIKENPPYSGVKDKRQSKSRRKKMRKFKHKYGFEYSDIWDLDQTLTGFLLPRMAFFAEKHTGFPCNLDNLNENGEIKNRDKLANEYQEKLNTIVEGLYLYYSRELYQMNKEEQELWEKAKQYLVEVWSGLWD